MVLHVKQKDLKGGQLVADEYVVEEQLLLGLLHQPKLLREAPEYKSCVKLAVEVRCLRNHSKFP